MNEVKRAFRRGEFVTNANKPGSFAIFEGIKIETNSVFDKYSVIVAYDPNKYRELPSGGWASQPYLDVATSTTRCEQSVDGDTSSSWWRPCTEREVEAAIEILESYGYHWDEESLSIIDTTTGEVVRTVITPEAKYNGEIVRPISRKLKELLKKVCDEITKKKYSYQNAHYYGFWDGDCWD
jgi:hypothetical protein